MSGLADTLRYLGFLKVSFLETFWCTPVWGGHRFSAWTRLPYDPEHPLLRFEQAKCQYCREWYVRPTLLEPWSGPDGRSARLRSD